MIGGGEMRQVTKSSKRAFGKKYRMLITIKGKQPTKNSWVDKIYNYSELLNQCLASHMIFSYDKKIWKSHLFIEIDLNRV